MRSCYSRFCADWRYSFFAVEEKPDYGTVDLDKSFCLNDSSSWYAKLIKLAIFLWATASFIYAWSIALVPSFFLAYLTNWTALFQIVYLGFSFLCTLSPQDWIVKAAWLMYSLSVVNGFIVFVLYWATEYNPNSYTLTYWQIVAHGVIFLATFLDGFLINRTPIRMKHMFWVMLWGILFIIWTIIFTVAGIDNPDKDDDKSQALYNILDWETKPAMSAGVSVGVVFVAFPVVHTLFWTLLLCRRVYVTNEGDCGNVEIKQMEEGESNRNFAVAE